MAGHSADGDHVHGVALPCTSRLERSDVREADQRQREQSSRQLRIPVLRGVRFS
jgi:hypothetical protein